MSFQIVTEPIASWPGESTRARSYSPFNSSYDSTLQLLNRELVALNASGPVVIQVVTRNGASDLRRDGLLRAQASIEHPGVRVSFESKHGPLTYATDVYEGRYRQPAWQANLRAIALGLEALRKVDRYGIAQSGEQYRGWQALAARPIDGGGLSREIAEQILTDEAGHEEGPFEPWPSVWRRARANAHPDRNNGDRTRWDAVERAARSLGLDQQKETA